MTRKEWTFIIWIAMLVLILFLASSCRSLKSAAGLLRHADKDVQAAIAKGAVIKSDTVFQQVKIPVPQVKTDTIFQAKDGDTVVIEKDRLLIRYIDRPGDTVEIHGECRTDTIYKEVPVTVTREIHAPKKGNPWKWIAVAFGAVLILSRLFWK